MLKQLTIKGLKTGYLINEYGVIINKYGKIVKPFKTETGYCRVGLFINNKQKKFFIHKLVALHYVKGDTNLQVNHIDGKKDNNHFTNLEWVTGSMNIRHALEHKLLIPPKGIKNGMCKYSEKDINHVCMLLEKGKSYKEIMFLTGVDYSVVKSIKNKKRWKHISCLYDFNNIEEGSTTILTNKNNMKKITVCVNKEILFNSDSYSKAVKFGIRSTAQVGG